MPPFEATIERSPSAPLPPSLGRAGTEATCRGGQWPAFFGYTSSVVCALERVSVHAMSVCAMQAANIIEALEVTRVCSACCVAYTLSPFLACVCCS